MNKINKLFKKVTNELWKIKRYPSTVEFKNLIDFYKDYKSHENLVMDAINAHIIQYDGLDMPFSEEDVSYMIEIFVAVNNYNYERLLIEALFVMNNEQAYQYLSKILDTEGKRMDFKRDFGDWPHFERTKKELLKLGNIL